MKTNSNDGRIGRLRSGAAEKARGAQELVAKAEREGRELTAGERATVDAALTDARQMKSQADGLESDGGMMAQIASLSGGRERVYTPGGEAGAALSTDPRALGSQFLASQTGRWLLSKHAGGGLPTGMWTSPASELQAATLTEDAASGGDLVVPHYLPGIVPSATRPLRVAQLFAPGTTGSNAVTSMHETTYTNTAATVAEGGTKTESTFIFDAVKNDVRKIAHWIPVTDEMLEDVPSLETYLNVRLGLGVDLELDDQLLNGNAAANPPELSGVLGRAALAAAVARGADTNADAIAKQISAIETAMGVRPEGIVIHPTNWLTIQLAKNGDGLYYGGGPFVPAQSPTLWGVPVAVTSAIAVGTALVGCFATFGQLFARGPLRVEATNSHSDYFIRNLIAIRAERRATLALYREAAFGTVTGLN
jgi:HK97 family phage major capsid protein